MISRGLLYQRFSPIEGGTSGGGPDTPWTIDHDANGFDLDNAKGIGIGGPAIANLGLCYTSGFAGTTAAVYAKDTSPDGGIDIELYNDQNKKMMVGINGSNVGLGIGYISCDNQFFLTSGGLPSVIMIKTNGNVGMGGNQNPGYPLDVTGDINITGTYRVNGTPISTGGSQTPWTSDINAAGFKVYNASKFIVGTAADVIGALQVTGDSYFTGKVLFSPDNTYDIGASGANRPKNIYMAGTLTIAQGITGGGQFATSASMSAVSGYIKTDAAGDIVYVNHAGGTVNGKYGLYWDKTLEQLVVQMGGSFRWNFRSDGSFASDTTNTKPVILLDQGATARGRVFQTVVTHNIWSSVNGYYDGTNFQRDDTSKASAFTQLQSANFSFGYTAAGTGPITITFPFTFDLANARLGINRSPTTYPLEVTGALYSLMSDATAARFGLLNTNRHWTITNYGTQFSPNGAFVVADETVGKSRLAITAAGAVGLSCPTAADDTANIVNNMFYCYVNEAGNTLTFRVKYSTGTIKQGTIALA